MTVWSSLCLRGCGDSKKRWPRLHEGLGLVDGDPRLLSSPRRTDSLHFLLLLELRTQRRRTPSEAAWRKEVKLWRNMWADMYCSGLVWWVRSGRRTGQRSQRPDYQQCSQLPAGGALPWQHGVLQQHWVDSGKGGVGYSGPLLVPLTLPAPPFAPLEPG